MEEFEEYSYDNIDNIYQLESWKVDEMIESVKNNNAEIEKFENQAKIKIEQIQYNLERQKETLLKRNQRILSTLREYALNQSDLKKTKTQFKWSSLSGDIIIKKPKIQPTKPSDDKLEELEQLLPEFIEKKEVKRFNWKDYKKNLVVQDGRVFDSTNGEEVTQYFPLEEKAEEVQVK